MSYPAVCAARIDFSIAVSGTVVALLRRCESETITARSQLARTTHPVWAQVFIEAVAVVATFNPGPHKAISTPSVHACTSRPIRAAIRDLVVAVVALLGALYDSVTTDRPTPCASRDVPLAI